MSRIKELDFLKCVLIILMVIFHLVYIGDNYPICKKIVYTFHMSGFLIISGYLAGVAKTHSAFFHKIIWILFPYMIMEAGYLTIASFLPVRETVPPLSGLVYLNKVFMHPIGPYWYIHTLILCLVLYYIIFQLFRKQSTYFRLLMLGVVYYLFSEILEFMAMSNAIYFWAGVVIRQSGLNFMNVFSTSLFSIIPLAILCYYPQNLDRGVLAGVAITYLSISFLLSLFNFIPGKAKTISSYIGQNTFIILLFSPIFTFMTRLFQPYFSFDASGICFMIVSVVFVLSGCFGITAISDRLHISAYFFGRERMLQSV